jgi:hydroxymethylglutaryl-CoA lyase
MLNGLGMRTGVDLEQLVEIGRWICGVLGKEPGSKVNKAYTKRA